MLKGVDPLLSPDLLHALRAMGHGDEIAIVDANFPAAANARRLIRLEGVTAPRVARAIASVLPLDDFQPVAAFRMAVTDDQAAVPAVAGEFQRVLEDEGYRRTIEPLERFAFYERTRAAYAIVATGETRLWGNLILKKGALRPS